MLTSTIVLTLSLVALGYSAQIKTKTKLIKSSDATKVDKPTNEAIGPNVQVGENNPAPNANAFDPQQGQASSGGFAAPYQGLTFGPQQGPSPQQAFSPVQWPGAPEPFQPAPVSSVDRNEFYDPRIKSPYQELLKSLAATAPIYPPEPLDEQQQQQQQFSQSLPANTAGGPGQIYFGQVAEGGAAYAPVNEADQRQHLDRPGPPRAPLNVENANYLTAVASIPSRLGPMVSLQSMPSQLMGSNMVSNGGGGFLLQNIQQPPSAPLPAPGKMTAYPMGPAPQAPYPTVGKPATANPMTILAGGGSASSMNPNQWIYTHGGNQYPMVGGQQSAGPSGNGFPVAPVKYPANGGQQLVNQMQYANFVRNQELQQQQASFNALRHPSNFSQFSAPRLSPFTVQVGDILGFPPGTPFSAVPAGLPSGSRMKIAEPTQTFTARSPAPAPANSVDPYRRGYSEITSENIRPNSVTKPDGYEKSEELSRENNAKPFSQQSNASVVSYTRSMCQVCDEIDKILKLYNVTVYTFELDTMDKGQEMYTLLLQQTGSKEMPQVFVCGRYIGGYSRVLDLHRSGELKRMFQRC